jgi:hypothetical protein
MVNAQVRALMALAKAASSVADSPDAHASEAAVLAALTAWFGSSAAITENSLPANLVGMLVAIGVDRDAAVQVGEMVLPERMAGRSRHGSPDPFKGMPATRRVAAEEPGFRARYVLAAARRLTEAIRQGKLKEALANERRYLAAHIAAGRNRRKAARQVDDIGANGAALVWRTAGDDRVEARCRTLEDRLFTASDPPDGQLPGAVHSRCRCHAAQWGGSLTWPFTR